MIYAVNKRTKEHKLVKNPDSATPGEEVEGKYFGDTWLMVQADADGWIPWHGGKRPLPISQRFDAKLRSGLVRQGCRMWDWIHLGAPSDTIAYRPILNDKEQDMSEQGSVSKSYLIRTFKAFLSPSIEEGSLEDRRERTRLFLAAMGVKKVVDLDPSDYAAAVAFATALSGESVDAEWSGEGLPPVGCRAVTSGGECTVVALQDDGNKACVRWYDGELAVIMTSCIKPIRTAAQRAEDEAVEAMHGYVTGSKAYAVAIYHAIRDGRIPGVKLEGVGK